MKTDLLWLSVPYLSIVLIVVVSAIVELRKRLLRLEREDEMLRLEVNALSRWGTVTTEKLNKIINQPMEQQRQIEPPILKVQIPRQIQSRADLIPDNIDGNLEE